MTRATDIQNVIDLLKNQKEENKSTHNKKVALLAFLFSPYQSISEQPKIAYDKLEKVEIAKIKDTYQIPQATNQAPKPATIIFLTELRNKIKLDNSLPKILSPKFENFTKERENTNSALKKQYEKTDSSWLKYAAMSKISGGLSATSLVGGFLFLGAAVLSFFFFPGLTHALFITAYTLMVGGTILFGALSGILGYISSRKDKQLTNIKKDQQINKQLDKIDQSGKYFQEQNKSLNSVSQQDQQNPPPFNPHYDPNSQNNTRGSQNISQQNMYYVPPPNNAYNNTPSSNVIPFGDHPNNSWNEKNKGIPNSGDVITFGDNQQYQSSALTFGKTGNGDG